MVDDIAGDLKANGAAGYQKRRQATLNEGGIVIGLKTLEAYAGLEFSGANREVRNVIELRVGVVENYRALAEVGPYEVIDVFVDRSGNGGPHAAEQDLIQQR